MYLSRRVFFSFFPLVVPNLLTLSDYPYTLVWSPLPCDFYIVQSVLSFPRTLNHSGLLPPQPSFRRRSVLLVTQFRTPSSPCRPTTLIVFTFDSSSRPWTLSPFDLSTVQRFLETLVEHLLPEVRSLVSFGDLPKFVRHTRLFTCKHRNFFSRP